MLLKKAKPLKKPGDSEHAYNYALFLLNLKLRTDPDVIDTTVDKLFQERLIDDDRYAEIYIENMKSYKQYGFFQMKKKLMEKLLPQRLIESKLAELVTVEDERVIAERYLATVMSSRTSGASRGTSRQARDGIRKEIKKLPYEEKQKIMRRLLARGFRMDTLAMLGLSG
ncbi:MAG: RecX family transcriptional regulator [bacterium]|nr:RecX family transcriptional regulator [bacterium]